MNEEFHIWKQHFINQAKGLIPQGKHFYKVSSQKGKGETTANIKMVSPTEQVVERAKSAVSQAPSVPPTVYDPVTGVIQSSKRLPHGKAISRKRKKKNTNKVPKKKRKVSSKKKTKKKKKINQKKGKKKTNKKKKQKWYL